MDRDEWNRLYEGRELVWSAEPNQFLVDEVADLAPGRALDLGAGEGRNAIWLAEHGWRVTAVDFARAGLEKARRIAAARGVDVDLVHADLTEYQPPPAAFDLVIVLYLHLRRTDMKTVLGRARDALSSAGTLLLIGHDRTNLEHGYGGPQSPEVLYTADDIAGLLGDLEICVAETRLRTVEAEQGTVHPIDCLVRARSRG
jgi:SAM-dependent methyltransferase